MLRQHLGFFPKSLFRNQQQPHPLSFNIICFASDAACSAGYISALKHSLAVCIREKWICTFNRNQCCSKVIVDRNESISSGEVERFKRCYPSAAESMPLSFLLERCGYFAPSPASVPQLQQYI